ncbi:MULTISPECIES: cyclophilin-like fold protein [unclassified Gemella]|uniref:cyclophilin-like fold protein n=1 Tax=unclassified Gemella TaxID=2624949 RepID=UPI001C04E084|nr:MULTISPECIES: cyclophilin-like fold protein [unclassified Gemella]MBU0278979.1 hypothetical protein [Gemella sp. zg-1178]QWQ38757.1 hypothetical protein KMP11_07405 [Gemella sp. zg-570]
MKKIFFLLLIAIFLLSACNHSFNKKVDTNSNNNSEEKIEMNKKIDNLKLNVKIDNFNFTAKLENNVAVRDLINLLKEKPIIIDMQDYSGFEKVGSLGQSIASDDKKITSQKGDIFLYNSRDIVIFYGTNTWNYTKIASIDDVGDLEKAMNNKNVRVEFLLIK